MKKILSSTLVILLQYKNIKIFLQKITPQIGLKKFSVIKKVKNTVPWTYVINHFYEKRITKNKSKRV